MQEDIRKHILDIEHLNDLSFKEDDLKIESLLLLADRYAFTYEAFSIEEYPDGKKLLYGLTNKTIKQGEPLGDCSDLNLEKLLFALDKSSD